MKSIKTFFTASFVILILSSFTGITDDVNTALKTGNAFELASFFNGKVDITIVDYSDLLSKLEAEKLLYDFFREHEPSDFMVLHHGESSSGLEYTIGKLITSNGIYRVSVYINTKENTEYVQQIIIDAE